MDSHGGLPNRSMFCQHVRNRFAEWNRGGTVFSVLLVEVRQYAQLTKDCGQPAKEASLRAAVKLATATLREMDFVAGYAPDCFAVLLPTALLADAVRVAERFRESFLRQNESAGRDRPRFALSIGAVQVRKDDDFLSLLKHAEEALDSADREGGNQTYGHDGERCLSASAVLESQECAV